MFTPPAHSVLCRQIDARLGAFLLVYCVIASLQFINRILDAINGPGAIGGSLDPWKGNAWLGNLVRRGPQSRLASC